MTDRSDMKQAEKAVNENKEKELIYQNIENGQTSVSQNEGKGKLRVRVHTYFL